MFNVLIMKTSDIPGILKEKGLKVTPQRVAVLGALYDFSGGHPSVDVLSENIRKNNQYIATGTIYKILEVFAENDLVKKVKTDNDIMRYDGITSQHHHLYSDDSGRIEDYYDEDINGILNEYFEKKQIPGFRIDDIQLQMKGKYTYK